ncbi:MAG TPA: sigma-70 family RNA polymerase sigma factor [Anaeromyxobacter sp.]|nr:sigma-70 family RNA polymerase sigma factor [Anaeromyxobacter sp.]
MSGSTGDRGREEVVRLYREFGPAVYRRCMRLLRDREAARDATQEVFVKLLRDGSLLGEGERALRWVYRVATYHCLNVRRDRLRRERRLEGAAAEAEAAAPEAPALGERQLAERLLSRFDPVTQAVALGMLVDGMEGDELAGALGISRRTVHRKLNRFLKVARHLTREEP